MQLTVEPRPNWPVMLGPILLSILDIGILWRWRKFRILGTLSFHAGHFALIIPRTPKATLAGEKVHIMSRANDHVPFSLAD